MDASPAMGTQSPSVALRLVIAGGDCLARGWYQLELASFAVEGGVCRCGFDDPWPMSPSAHDITNGPSFSVSFSKPVMIFEDACECESGILRPRRSTRVQLTVSAYGGPNGGRLTLLTSNVSKLAPVVRGPLVLPFNVNLLPFESYFESYICEAAEESESENDVVVSGIFTDDANSETIDSSTRLTIVRLDLQAFKRAPKNRSLNRHKYGIGEKMLCLQYPSSPVSTLNVVDANILGSGGSRIVEFGVSNVIHTFTVSLMGTLYDPHVTICTPSNIAGCEAMALTNGLPAGVSGGLKLVQRYRVLPLDVNFEGLSIEEVPCDDVIPPTGYFIYVPTNIAYRSHTVDAGAGNWIDVLEDNYIGDGETKDRAGYLGELPRKTQNGDNTTDATCDWLGGSLIWKVPFGWRAVFDKRTPCDMPTGRFAEDTRQVMTISRNGDFSVEKLDHKAIRRISGEVSVDGDSSSRVITTR